MFKKVISIGIVIVLLMSLVLVPNVNAKGASATYTVLEDYEKMFSDFKVEGANAGSQCPPVHVFNREAMIWNPTGSSTAGDVSTFGITGTSGYSGMSWFVATGNQFNETGITTDTSIRLTMYAWDATASATMRLSYGELPPIVDNTQAIVVRLGVKNATATTNISFGMYQDGVNGELTTYYGKKTNLNSLSAYLIGATTKKYTKVNLATKNGYFVPITFDGWVVLPMSYFNLDSNFDMEKVTALRVNTSNGGSQTNLYIDEIGVTSDINDFIEEKGKLDMTIVNFAKTFPTFLPGGLYGTGEPHNGTGITSTNLVANTALVSWWDPLDVPSGISTQAIGGKRVVSTNLNTNDGAVAAHTYGSMPMAVKLVSATTDSNASAIIALKNAGGVTAASPITSKYASSEAVAIRMATWTHPGATGINSLYPGVYFDLYEQKTGETDGRSLGEKFVRKTAANLLGTTVYLIDATTGAVTEKSIGTTSTDTTLQEKSSCFVPNNFDGWVVLPLSYFTYKSADSLDVAGNQFLDVSNLVGITVGEKYSREDSNFYIGEVVLTDIEGFVREKSKSDMTILDYKNVFPDFLPNGQYGTNNGGTGITSTPTAINTGLLSWWSNPPVNIPTQWIYNKYVASTNLSTNFGSIVAQGYGTMPMAVKLAYSTTGSNASAVIPLKNAGGVTVASPITSQFANSEAITIRMATTTPTSSSKPGVYFDLFEQMTGSTDAQRLGEKYVRKSAADLVGTTVYLIDATTLSVTEKALGTSSTDVNIKEDASCFVPNNFDGWVVVPLSYFNHQPDITLDGSGNRTLDITNLVGINIGEKTSRTDSNLYIGEVGLTQSVFNFVKGKITGQDKVFDFTTTTTANIPKIDYEYYQNASTQIIANVSLNSILQYTWYFNGKNIQLPMEYNPVIEIKNSLDSGINKLAYNAKDCVYLQMAHTGEMPGKTSLKVKVPNFTEGKQLYLYSYNTDGGGLVKISYGLIVDNGYTTFEINIAGNYVINDEELKLVSSYRNISVADFEINPLKQLDNGTENLMYDNNVLIRNNTVGATGGLVTGINGGYTGVNTVNSTKNFAFGDLDTAIQFWPMNSAPCSATFNLNNTGDNGQSDMQFIKNSEMIVVRLATRTIGWMEDPAPSFYFDLYEKNAFGGLGEMFTRKSAENLVGTTAYLIDADTESITEIDLGTDSNIIPNGFDGTLMLPLSYFTYDVAGSGSNSGNQTLDLEYLKALRIGVLQPHESFTYAIDEIGFAKQYNLKKTDYIKDEKVWTTPYLDSENGFGIDMALYHVPDETKNLITKNSITNYGLGSLNLLTPEPYVGEFDTAFIGRRGLTDGRGLPVIPDPYKTAASTRPEILRRIFEFVTDNYLQPFLDHTLPRTSLTGVYPWQHYAGEMGFDRIGVELGEAISSYQSKIAFTRGASRQYGKTWFVDFSAWHQGYMLDYSTSDDRYWLEGGPNYGHSMSLMNRTFMMSYMSGMNFFIAEAGSLLAFNKTQNANGFYDLTPYGETIQKCNAFATKNPDVGTAYTPFGLVLDYYHGSSGGDDGINNDAKKAFYTFDYEAGDDMSYNILNTFFPSSLQVVGFEETTTMVNSPYGDTCDVLLQNASQKVLNNYPSLILSGNINFSKEEAERYKIYVNQGGILVLNTAYLHYFSEYESLYNGSRYQEIVAQNGKVIVYGPDFDTTQLPSILSDLRDKFIPFIISEDVEYIMNVKDGSLILTLINNNGVTKNPETRVLIDGSKEINLNVTFTGNKDVLSSRELISGSEVAINNGIVNVSLIPGEVKVIEFNFEVSRSKVIKDSSKFMTEFRLPAFSPTIFGKFNGSNISVTVPSNTNLTSLVANFTTSLTSTVTINGVTQVSGITANNFTNPLVYRDTAQDGSFIEYIVTVTKEIACSTNIYSVSNDGTNTITRVSPNSSLNTFMQNMSLGSNVTYNAFNNKNQPLDGAGLVGTGTKINIYNADHSLFKTYNVLMYGDVDGNGEVGLRDLTSVRDHILEGTQLQGACLKSGDLYREGSITLNDLVGIMAAVSEVSVISQKYSATAPILDKSTMSIIKGSTGNLTATVNPLYADNKSVIWWSSNTSKAKVSSNGVVTGVSPGKATITVATVDGLFTATCEVTVMPISATGVTLDKSILSLGIGVTSNIIATISPSNADNNSLRWSSSSLEVATVDILTGDVTGIGVGTATITAKTVDGGFVKTCLVTVVRYDSTKYYKIAYSDRQTLVMDSTNTGSGGVVKHVTYSGDDSQQWQITEISAGVFKIINKATGLALNVSSAINWYPINIIQSTYSNSNRMNWAITDSGSYVKISSKLGSNTYIKGTGTTGNILVTAATSTTDTTQQWVITLIS